MRSFTYLYYVRRTKKKTGNECYSTLHVADSDKTLCGKELDGRWFIEPAHGLNPEDVNCMPCSTALQRRLQRRVSGCVRWD